MQDESLCRCSLRSQMVGRYNGKAEGGQTQTPGATSPKPKIASRRLAQTDTDGKQNDPIDLVAPYCFGGLQ